MRSARLHFTSLRSAAHTTALAATSAAIFFHSSKLSRDWISKELSRCLRRKQVLNLSTSAAEKKRKMSANDYLSYSKRRRFSTHRVSRTRQRNISKNAACPTRRYRHFSSVSQA